jgi:hypothetical protein
VRFIYDAAGEVPAESNGWSVVPRCGEGEGFTVLKHHQPCCRDTTTRRCRGTRGRLCCARKVDMLAAVTRGPLSCNEGTGRSARQTSLGVESREPEPMQYRTWPADPGSVANLYSIGSSQRCPGVVARGCRPSLLLHPRAAGGDRQCCVCLVMLFAAVEAERHLLRPLSAVVA